MNLRQQAQRLRERFQALADADDPDIPGMQKVAAGLRQLLGHLDDEGRFDEQRLALIVHGLSGVADAVEVRDSEPDDGSTEVDDPQGLDRFVATFREDVGKRLQGLSISLMGIFGEDKTEEALEQSTEHLHAIRGSAAMLGLDDIAELSGEMEQALASMSALAAGQRQWPTKTLLRGYALLEQAVKADPPAIEDKETATEVVETLRQIGNDAASASTPSGSASTKRGVSRETTPAPSTDSAQPSDSDTRGRLEQPILVVDDVETIAASVGFVLSELEVPVEIASHGQEAVQMLRQKPFSLVISDVDMPRMDGIALTKMIRSSDEWSQLPVILLTSLDHPEERKAGMEAGATDYIIKGAIGGGELVRRVRELLTVAPVVRRRERRRQKRILVAEDTETVAASIAFVLSEGPFEIAIANDGKDAIRQLRDDDFELLITDMQMPYMSGTELVESVRADDRLSQLPVIMLTSVDDEDVIAEAEDVGVNRYLLKGEIQGGKLLTIVEELLGD